MQYGDFAGFSWRGMFGFGTGIPFYKIIYHFVTQKLPNQSQGSPYLQFATKVSRVCCIEGQANCLCDGVIRFTNILTFCHNKLKRM